MNIVVIEYGKIIKMGKFKVEFIPAAHSIVESYMLFIETPSSRVLHTGDWKIDLHPGLGHLTDEKRIKEIVAQGPIDMITCDSTNAKEKGWSLSEQVVKENIAKSVKKNNDCLLLVSCFSSNITRIHSFIEAAKNSNRKIFAIGNSLQKYITAAQRLKYLAHDSIKILQNISQIPNENCIVLCTGSQAEKGSTLMKIAYSTKPLIQHLNNKPMIKVKLILSSKPIPGNDLDIHVLRSELMKKNVEIFESDEQGFHASGHAYRNEIKLLLSWVMPGCFVPMHGDYEHLVKNAEIAKELGIENLLTGDGAIVKINGSKSKIVGQFPVGILGLDGNRLINMEAAFLRDREKLSTDGVVFVVVNTDQEDVTALCHGLMDNRTKGYEIMIKKLCEEVHARLFMREKLENRELIVNIVKQITIDMFDNAFQKNPVVVVSLNRPQKTMDQNKPKTHFRQKPHYHKEKKEEIF